MNPELTWMDGRRFLNWLEAQMREGGWLPTFPTVRAVFDCLVWPFSLAFGRAPSVGCSCRRWWVSRLVRQVLPQGWRQLEAQHRNGAQGMLQVYFCTDS